VALEASVNGTISAALVAEDSTWEGAREGAAALHWESVSRQHLSSAGPVFIGRSIDAATRQELSTSSKHIVAVSATESQTSGIKAMKGLVLNCSLTESAELCMERNHMSVKTIDELLLDELKDLYSAEKQITKALPKMAKAAVSKDLKSAFESHLEETQGHVERLDKIFETLGKSPKGKTCHGMQGLVEEGSEMMSELEKGPVRDAGLISAAQRVEHYEMAGYGSVREYASLLGHKEIASLLNETLEEEKATDEKLNGIAKKINPQALKANKAA
jgi:ferritin-like metal-binding protein YciE